MTWLIRSLMYSTILRITLRIVAFPGFVCKSMNAGREHTWFKGLIKDCPFAGCKLRCTKTVPSLVSPSNYRGLWKYKLFVAWMLLRAVLLKLCDVLWCSHKWSVLVGCVLGTACAILYYYLIIYTAASELVEVVEVRQPSPVAAWWCKRRETLHNVSHSLDWSCIQIFVPSYYAFDEELSSWPLKG